MAEKSEKAHVSGAREKLPAGHAFCYHLCGRNVLMPTGVPERITKEDILKSMAPIWNKSATILSLLFSDIPSLSLLNPTDFNDNLPALLSAFYTSVVICPVAASCQAMVLSIGYKKSFQFAC